jgi:hypothetical protein
MSSQQLLEMINKYADKLIRIFEFIGKFFRRVEENAD